jgi:hypothetical protein
MIDNSTLIYNEILEFPHDDCFYFVEVIQRRKENPEMLKHALTLADYYISSHLSFMQKLPEIKAMCDAFNARAYMRVNFRRYTEVALDVNLKVAELLRNKNYKAVMSVYPSAVGDAKNHDPRKFRLIDLDGEQADKADEYVRTILDLLAKPHFPAVYKIPTKNGIHIVSEKFDTKKFRNKHNEIANDDIKGDANTILYQP